ncbi:hypothetical protein [Streptomyces muensis]|uniref:Type A2 lantipeptide n=1 Tax=Streptomyces muensis TaxID=1077944 RepID=A0A9X1TKP3_STRM4|nr:hypothetical protein [Streptomyces muensis]MCF1594250.1 hypothetical protein [Streptomyces muensis]
MSYTSQVETAEIADAALDNISGGQAGAASAGLTGALSGGLSDSLSAVACVDAFAAISPEGVALGLHAHAAAH